MERWTRSVGSSTWTRNAHASSCERSSKRIQRELEELRSETGGDGELSNVDQHHGGRRHRAVRGGARPVDDRPARARARGDRRALKRVEDGTYGVSVESGEPIPDARLEAVPQAERTVEEQAARDAAPKLRLSDRSREYGLSAGPPGRLPGWLCYDAALRSADFGRARA